MNTTTQHSHTHTAIENNSNDDNLSSSNISMGGDNASVDNNHESNLNNNDSSDSATNTDNSKSNNMTTTSPSKSKSRFFSSSTDRDQEQDQEGGEEKDHSSCSFNMLSSPNAISEAILAEAMNDCKRSRLSSSTASSWNENMESMDDIENMDNHVDETNNTQATVDDGTAHNDCHVLSPNHDHDQCDEQNNVDSTDINSFTAKQSDRLDNDKTCTSSRKKQKTTHDETDTQSNTHNHTTKTSSIEEAIEQINEIRCKSKKKKNPNNNNNYDIDHSLEIDDALDQTKKIVYGQLDHIIRLGLDAFHKNDSLKRELIQAKELCESRKREIQRLKVLVFDTRAS